MNYLRTGLLALMFIMGAVGAQQAIDLNAIQRLVAQGEWDKALAEVNQRIAANPDDIESLFVKGLVLMQKDDTAGARNLFAELARRFPHLPEAYNNLAAIYTADGDYEAARQALLSAIVSEPRYSPVRANLGDLYAKMAIDSYREALRLNPDDAASQAKLKVLEPLFGSGR